MILRRLSQHVKDQNWFAVGLDFCIVVAGILIAFQITSWNEARQERAMERDTLLRLYADIEESIAGQTRDLNFLTQQLADQEIVLSSLDTCSVAPENDIAFQRGISTLAYINPPRFYRRTVDEIAASGRTDIFRNPEITAELARIVSLVEWRAAGHAQIIGTAEYYRRNIEIRVRHDLSRILDDEFIPNHRSGIIYSIGDLCQDPTLANGISAISYQTMERLEAYQPILEGYHALLPMIVDELKNRWSVGRSEAIQ